MLTPGISPMAFALNNPVSFNDPTGLMGETPIPKKPIETGAKGFVPLPTDAPVVKPPLETLPDSGEQAKNAQTNTEESSENKQNYTIGIVYMGTNAEAIKEIKGGINQANKFLVDYGVSNIQFVHSNKTKRVKANGYYIISDETFYSENEKAKDYLFSIDSRIEKYFAPGELKNWLNGRANSGDYEVSAKFHLYGLVNGNVAFEKKWRTLFFFESGAKDVICLTLLHILGHNAGYVHGILNEKDDKGIMATAPLIRNQIAFAGIDNVMSINGRYAENNKRIWAAIIKHYFR
jgi:hypothetical protein